MAEINAKSRSGNISGVFATLLIVFAFVLLTQGFGGMFFSMFGLYQSDDGQLMSHGKPEHIRMFMILSQFFATVIGLLIFPMAYLFLLRKELFLEILELKPRQWPMFAMLGMLLMLTALPVVGILGQWNTDLLKQLDVPSLEKLENIGKEMTELILRIENVADLLFVILVVAVLPGVAEELVFRGILQNTLQKYIHPHLAVIIAAFVFSFIHFQFFGFFPRWYLGILLGYIYLFSGNILLSMLAHFFNNFIAVMAYYLHQKGSIETHPDALDKMAMPLPLVLASAGFAVLIWIRMWRMHQSRV